MLRASEPFGGAADSAARTFRTRGETVKHTLAPAWALTAVLALMAAAATTAMAQDDKEAKGPTLKPGDPAPPLAVDKWVKGEAVKELEKGKVYVIECWATWCGPCVRAIPHVTELQKKYQDKGLVVIGMNIWENDIADVEPFVKKMGDKMDYRVATDDTSDGGRGKMAETWMAAAGKNGIPCSFIVDREGRIAWIGHPMGMDKPLEEIIEGKFDLDKAQEEARQQDKLASIEQRFGKAMQAQDWDKALAAIDEALGVVPDEMKKNIRPSKLMVLLQKEDYDAANAEAKDLVEGEAGKDQVVLLNVAARLLDAKDKKKVDLDLAMGAAEKASKAEGELAWAGKSLMAKAHSAKGDPAKAVELQTAAMENAPDGAKQQLQAELDQYKEQATSKDAGKAGAEPKKTDKE
jgi:thiol-disulfide isomerase/thioredoxin